MENNNNRISSRNITLLKANEIFVFGSNTMGRHGKGAAKQAYIEFGALYFQAEGLQGKSYGIPTCKELFKPLELDKIAKYVDNFIEFAKSRQHLVFLVTEIGCGLAYYKPKDIAPLFKNAKKVENIYLPESFWFNLFNN